MSDVEDQYEEDDNRHEEEERHNAANDLFDDDDDVGPQGQAEEELYDEVVENAAPQAPQDKGQDLDDRKAALAKLLEKKKRQADDEDGQGQARRKKLKDKGSDKPRKEKGSKEKGGKLKKRDKREKRKQEGNAEPAGEGLEDDVDSDAVEENAADKAFIDDEGVEEEHIGSDVVDDEEDDGAAPAEEAEEVAPGQEEEDKGDGEEEDLFKKKRKRKDKESDLEMFRVVDNKVAKMEAAAEEDAELHFNGLPAVQKLKILMQVEEFLAQKKYHELFINSGGLGVLKAWLEPYKDGSLPNVRIRSSILRACKMLPIDTTREDMKGQLKKSQLGSRVMFLSKCKDETIQNQALARELVQQWSRPIFYDHEKEEEKRAEKEKQLKEARARALEQQKQVEATQAATVAGKAKPKVGEAGYRWHASIPATSKLDYVVEPQKAAGAPAVAAAAGAHNAPKDNRFAKKMREVVRKQKGNAARAAKPSVEGRSIVLMH
mmetsp:Transcript_25094/g.54577  ORF Transcript_25094/g.54577 Transcript_25094/m.54577 type:complete len:489 (-) Transcript_25094:841-2307(-)